MFRGIEYLRKAEYDIINPFMEKTNCCTYSSKLTMDISNRVGVAYNSGAAKSLT